jgi:hypothetical protein
VAPSSGSVGQCNLLPLQALNSAIYAICTLRERRKEQRFIMQFRGITIRPSLFWENQNFTVSSAGYLWSIYGNNFSVFFYNHHGLRLRSDGLASHYWDQSKYIHSALPCCSALPDEKHLTCPSRSLAYFVSVWDISGLCSKMVFKLMTWNNIFVC